MIKVLKYMAITAAAMAVVEAHALTTPSDYKLFNMAIAKTVVENPECFSPIVNLMTNMPSEYQAVSAIVDDARMLGAPTLVGLNLEINEAGKMSAMIPNSDTITSRCSFLLGQAYGGMAGYFYFSDDK